MVGIRLAAQSRATASYPVTQGDFGMPNLMVHPALGEELDLAEAFVARFEEEEEGAEWDSEREEGWDDEDDLDDDEWDEDDDDWDEDDDEWDEDEGWDDDGGDEDEI
jgi:hypothetical protein